MGKVLKLNSMRVSQIESINYSLSYIVASSMGGVRKTEVGVQPFDVAVSLNIDLIEFPKIKAAIESQP